MKNVKLMEPWRPMPSSNETTRPVRPVKKKRPAKREAAAPVPVVEVDLDCVDDLS
jgi:hypothetical protein